MQRLQDSGVSFLISKLARVSTRHAPHFRLRVDHTRLFRLYSALSQARPTIFQSDRSRPSNQNAEITARKVTSLSKVRLDPPKNLEEFERHAELQGANKESTTYLGNHYEYVVMKAFSNYGMMLTKVGGRGDKGVDVRGTWDLPGMLAPIHVVIQCKRHATRILPADCRGLWGTMEHEASLLGVSNAPVVSLGVLGIMVSPMDASDGTYTAVTEARRPMAFAQVDTDGSLCQWHMNSLARQIGLEGLTLRKRHGLSNLSTPRISLAFGGRLLTGRKRARRSSTESSSLSTTDSD